MNYLKPVYTEKANCQDCYKCVRACPVKAIKVEDGSATVMYELCIMCGTCVEVCPAGAKKVRDDLGRVRQLLRLKDRVIASLAPSFVSEFPGLKPARMIAALKRLGFYGVSETAIGAQEVSANVAELLQKNEGKLLISSACPSVVEYLKKYKPQVSGYLTNLLSPLLSQCRLLKSIYGSDIGIVFIGPCIAKKKEADLHPELLDAAITYEDLRRWLKEENLSLEELACSESDTFIPEKAKEGALYPVDGGMIAGLKASLPVTDCRFMSFSGISNISNALRDAEKLELKDNLFLELLACNGGCINGPKAQNRCSTLLKRYNVISQAEYPEQEIPRKPSITIEENFNVPAVERKQYSEREIRAVLDDIGKINHKDELNCAGCGYNSCRDFAVSFLDGKSEKTMCVSYMRQLAQKKANALIKTMPSGIVIVDDKLKIVESNQNFAHLMGEETEFLFEVKPGLEGAFLNKIAPFYKLFQNVLESGTDIVGKEINHNGSVLLFSIFTIEKNRYVGGIFRDITEPWVRKEQIITKAKQVIRKNLSTVQKIAYLLGENAAETEVILNGIIESFSTDKIDDIDG
ncbi:MAG: [Fe-Fe] hydrogenase large subunit C-terminal domain-containing protein [Bacteroidota bacterium]|jgi:iron only hydrogenase large subunit-like protein|nr:4Fe-4S binding protein [Ignavibacteria bacterium]MCU7498223.1 4Fe-4S binding protein [Ignavibacteria bacterium]MCU7511285.1 4Fe-4S binding protein [Ignavibacteria bacterium]MCU7518993.1 4Fe-4S binding protein [Ignavibacteria bacterium]MCU7523274.1 4Fe-4S binding protein [Ignavibacteria bacterium]